jgi:hypothetical protein
MDHLFQRYVVDRAPSYKASEMRLRYQLSRDQLATFDFSVFEHPRPSPNSERLRRYSSLLPHITRMSEATGGAVARDTLIGQSRLADLAIDASSIPDGSFASLLREADQRWIRFRQSNGLRLPMSREVLVVRMMHISTYEKLTALRPRLTDLDKLFLAFCRTHRVATSPEPKAELRRIMNDCESLLPRALVSLRVGFRARSPVTCMRLVSRAWRDGRDLLTQVLSEVGLEDEMPLANALVIHAMIPNFMSKSLYLIKCFSDIAEQFTATEMNNLGKCVKDLSSGWQAFLEGCEQVTDPDRDMFSLFPHDGC